MHGGFYGSGSAQTIGAAANARRGRAVRLRVQRDDRRNPVSRRSFCVARADVAVARSWSVPGAAAWRMSAVFNIIRTIPRACIGVQRRVGGDPGRGAAAGSWRACTLRRRPRALIEIWSIVTTTTALAALERLREGNERFVSGTSATGLDSHGARRGTLLAGQKPFAIILGCSDSRVPAEIVFDQTLGDLFVIRVAGNIVAPSQVGSIEFAADRFGTELVVVLGHSQCGAVEATVEQLERPSDGRSPNLRLIVDRIRPTVQTLLETELRHDRDALIRQAVRANIRASVDHLRHGSQILEQLIYEQRLLVVGAHYALDTGVVEFFEGVPEAGSVPVPALSEWSE